MRVPVLVLLIISIKITGNFAIEKRGPHNGEQKLLLRKLLSLQQNNSTEKALMWNEILANMLVNQIRTMFHKPPQYQIKEKPDAVTTFVSQVMGIFNKLFYKDKDKLNSDTNKENVVDEEKFNPKDDVEEVGPKYHGRLENTNGTENFDFDKRAQCPNDLLNDGKGNCVDPKTSKFIMAIPRQCPIGYRRDRLGYCRAYF